MIIVETGNKFITVENIVVQCGTELDKVIDLWCDDKLPLGNDSNLLIVFYVQIMPDDFVMQLHRF